jgi:hypothetical protein
LTSLARKFKSFPAGVRTRAPLDDFHWSVAQSSYQRVSARTRNALNFCATGMLTPILALNCPQWLNCPWVGRRDDSVSDAGGVDSRATRRADAVDVCGRWRQGQRARPLLGQARLRALLSTKVLSAVILHFFLFPQIMATMGFEPRTELEPQGASRPNNQTRNSFAPRHMDGQASDHEGQFAFTLAWHPWSSGYDVSLTR